MPRADAVAGQDAGRPDGVGLGVGPADRHRDSVRGEVRPANAGERATGQREGRLERVKQVHAFTTLLILPVAEVASSWPAVMSSRSVSSLSSAQMATCILRFTSATS